MQKDSVSRKILKSSLWEYLGSWINKLIGFVSTLILARILVPDDFGIVAAVSIVTGFFYVMATVGTEQYLIRKSSVIIDEYNTGWTINIIMKALSALAIYLLAVPISEFMGDDRLILVLEVSCITPLLSGFTNIGLVLYEKEFNYRPRFVLSVISRVVGFVVKIAIAFYYHSYWAFIIAEIIEGIVNVFGSFVIHKFRPKFSLLGWKRQWEFSQWILLKSFFVFMRFRVDNIFISKYLAIDALGMYSVAKDVATLPAGQIIEPIMQPLYVGLSSIKDDAILLADKAHKSLSMLFIIVIPISFGTYITADNLVNVLLGSQWQHASSIVKILAFMLIPGVLASFLTKIMMVMGRVKLIFKFEVLLSFIALGAFYFLSRGMLLNEFALLRVLVIFFNTIFMLLFLTKLTKLSFFRILGLIVIPLLSSLVMVKYIVEINGYIIYFSSIHQLGVQIIVGGLIYLLMISAFIYLFRNKVNEYQFIWKTFYLNIFIKGK